jgi:hypothetical protein
VSPALVLDELLDGFVEGARVQKCEGSTHEGLETGDRR